MGIIIADAAAKIAPRLEDEVIVEVVGKPGASKQQLYFLALAAACGTVRRINALGISALKPFGRLMIEYDAAANWVRCTLAYNFSTLSATAAGNNVRGDFFDTLAVYRGPNCGVTGDEFNFVEQIVLGFGVLPGIPASAVAPSAPNLPFKGEPILTDCPVTIPPQPGPITQAPAPTGVLNPGALLRPPIASPNPQPPGDNRSRGGVVSPGLSPVPGLTASTCCEASLQLVPLVYAALTAPGSISNTVFPAPTPGATGS